MSFYSFYDWYGIYGIVTWISKADDELFTSRYLFKIVFSTGKLAVIYSSVTSYALTFFQELSTLKAVSFVHPFVV